MTHVERVYELLSDGKPHSHHEGYALGVVFHSRISDLRRRGIEVRHWRENGTSYYQLVSELTEREVAKGGPGSSRTAPFGANGVPRPANSRSVSSFDSFGAGPSPSDAPQPAPKNLPGQLSLLGTAA